MGHSDGNLPTWEVEDAGMLGVLFVRRLLFWDRDD